MAPARCSRGRTSRPEGAADIVRSPKASEDEKRAAQVALQKLPRNGAKARIRNRCQMSGRSRGYVAMFGLSRIAFRDMSLQGLIPGVRKASW